MKTLISTLILGAGLTFGIAGNVNGQENVNKRCKDFANNIFYTQINLDKPVLKISNVRVYASKYGVTILDTLTQNVEVINKKGEKIYSGVFPLTLDEVNSMKDSYKKRFVKKYSKKHDKYSIVLQSVNPLSFDLYKCRKGKKPEIIPQL